MELDHEALKDVKSKIAASLKKGSELRKEKSRPFNEVIKMFTAKENEIEQILAQMQALLNKKAEIELEQRRKAEQEALLKAEKTKEATTIVSAFKANLLSEISKFTLEQKQLCVDGKPFVKYLSDVEYKRLCAQAMASVGYKHHTEAEAKKLVHNVFVECKNELVPAYARDMADFELQPSLEVAREEAEQAIEVAERNMEAEIAMATTMAAIDTIPEISPSGALKIKVEKKYSPETAAEWLAIIAFYHQKGKLTPEWCAKNLGVMLNFANSEYKKNETVINGVRMVEVVKA
jgi:hypothetical protein